MVPSNNLNSSWRGVLNIHGSFSNLFNQFNPGEMGPKYLKHLSVGRIAEVHGFGKLDPTTVSL